MAPDFARNIAKWESLFGFPPAPAPVVAGYPVLGDEAQQQQAYREDLGRRLASPDRTAEDVLEALDWGAAR